MQFLFAILLSLASLHPVHFSFTNVEYNEKDKAIEVISRISYEDINSEIERLHNIDLKLGTANEHYEADEYITQWFTSVFTLNVDNKEIASKDFKLVSRNIENHEMHLIFKVKADYPQQLKIKNTILTEKNHGQSNLMIVKFKQFIDSYELTKTNHTVSVTL